MMRLVECPRDAMQGITTFIPTETKIRYLNQLLRVGYHTLDFGSFVSEKAIPQLRDTEEVLQHLDLSDTSTRLLAIVANLRGAEKACSFDEIDAVGYPFSVSETFQQRNTNSSIAESLVRVGEIQRLCVDSGKDLVVYLSMGFGNPYGDPYNPEVVTEWCRRLSGEYGIRILAPSDTIGVADPTAIRDLFSILIPALPEVEFGAHLHTTPDTWREKADAAWKAGVRRFDGALRGYGGCPMAADQLTGNMPGEKLVEYCNQEGIPSVIDKAELSIALMMAAEVFPHT
ncbi:MAG: hydroxymethylglutaryl-CoA lyase [Flavobacteriales bacterium]|jgi:hydroxymethylglutaryl-CoA lyase